MSLLGDHLGGPRVRLEADGPSEYRILRVPDGAPLGRLTLEERLDIAAGGHPTLTPGKGFCSPAAVGEGSRLSRAANLEHRASVLFVRSICIDPAHRGFGAGSGAATLLREAAEAAGTWHYLRAWAPPEGGLAVYFWSRMGLRPIPGDGPEGGLLLERSCSDAYDVDFRLRVQVPFVRQGGAPHVHALRAGGEAKVWLSPVSLAYARRYNDPEVNKILALVIENQQNLLKVWNDYFGR